MANSANLLRITTVPAQIEIRSTRASLEAPGGRRLPRPNVQVTRPGIRQQSRPAQLNIDSYAARASLGHGTMNPFDFTRDIVQRAWQQAEQGTIRIVEDGNMLARGSTAVELAVNHQRANFHLETAVNFLPTTGPEFSVTEGYLDLDISPNDVSIDWEHIQAERMIFNPGSVDVTVVQHPEVIVEFVGEPLYFPPSANPNYQPINITV